MKRLRAFTLVELIVVIAIIAILVGLTIPNVTRVINKSRNVVCMNNLRQIGTAVRLYITDNDNTFPTIEMSPNETPIYPPEVEAKPMLETLIPYGVTLNTLRCPRDVTTVNYFGSVSNSYQWLPRVDDENGIAPMIYRRGTARLAKPSRVRIVCDQEAVHDGLVNWLFADGSVSRIQ